MTAKKQNGRDHWFRDWLIYGPNLFPFFVIVIVAVMGGAALPLLAFIKSIQQNTVVVYCAQDQVFAEPIFKEFTEQTHIKVRPAFDSEAVKTVGLANRLLAERTHPQ